MKKVGRAAPAPAGIPPGRNSTGQEFHREGREHADSEEDGIPAIAGRPVPEDTDQTEIVEDEADPSRCALERAQAGRSRKSKDRREAGP